MRFKFPLNLLSAREGGLRQQALEIDESEFPILEVTPTLFSSMNFVILPYQKKFSGFKSCFIGSKTKCWLRIMLARRLAHAHLSEKCEKCSLKLGWKDVWNISLPNEIQNNPEFLRRNSCLTGPLDWGVLHSEHMPSQPSEWWRHATI